MAWVQERLGKAPADRLVIREYAATWIKQRPGLRPRTIQLYEGLLSRHISPYFTGVTLAKIDNNPAAIRAYASMRWGELAALRRGDLDLTAATVRIERTQVKVGGRITEGPAKSRAGRRRSGGDSWPG
jgi:integrase